MRSLVLTLALLPAIGHADGGYVTVAAGDLRSVLKYEDSGGVHRVRHFQLMGQPVSNGEFLAFVRDHPQWQRGRAPSVFAEVEHYLTHWSGPVRAACGACPRPWPARITCWRTRPAPSPP